VQDVHQLLGGQVQHGIEVDATEGELAEGTLLLQLQRAVLINLGLSAWAASRSDSVACSLSRQSRAQGAAQAQASLLEATPCTAGGNGATVRHGLQPHAQRLSSPFCAVCHRQRRARQASEESPPC